MFEVDGVKFSLEQMLEANRDDEALCAWLRVAEIDDRFPAFVTRVRVA